MQENNCFPVIKECRKITVSYLAWRYAWRMILEILPSGSKQRQRRGNFSSSKLKDFPSAQCQKLQNYVYFYTKYMRFLWRHRTLCNLITPVLLWYITYHRAKFQNLSEIHDKLKAFTFVWNFFMLLLSKSLCL